MFSIKESLKYGWQKFKANLEISLLATLFVLAFSSLSGKGRVDAGEILFFLGLIVFLTIIKIGYTKIFLKINDGEEVKFVDIFKEYKTFWRYLGVSVLSPLVVLAGLILLIVPGIIWAD